VDRLTGWFALAAFCLVSAVPALAQSGRECAGIDGDSDRLACYDQIFRAGAAQGEGLSFSFQSEQLIPARPTGRAPATITVSCVAGELNVAFAYAGNAMASLGRDAGITFQIDLQPARSRTLLADASNTALVIDNSADAEAFLDMLVGANNLTTRVTPVNSRSLSVRFNLAGVLEQVEPVRAACS
jgi:hypothetical protein